jgi:uncharacterized damage-inducible protein DinB
MATPSLPEVWLRGALPGIPPLLQPVAHALLQAREELQALLQTFPDEALWERPGGVASPAFHLQHLSGVLDRLLTYARGEALSAAQLAALKSEGVADPLLSTAGLVGQFSMKVDEALYQLARTDEASLTEYRAVGRAALPSTVGGLLFHAAEHTMRHLGQLLVTLRILQGKAG